MTNEELIYKLTQSVKNLREREVLYREYLKQQGVTDISKELDRIHA